MNPSRTSLIQKLNDTPLWDVIVIGGGASGLGVALDAVSRGLKTVLVERQDFGCGTSGKSTKLAHGGVRYLAQGYLSLVREALKERKFFMNNAGHLSHVQKFLIPVYNFKEAAKYYLGLKVYDILSSGRSMGATQWLSKIETKKCLPFLKTDSLLGSIEYTDVAFDDARLCIDLVTTIHRHEGVCLNYCECIGFLSENDMIQGITIYETINQRQFKLMGKLVVNATGVFASQVMDLAGGKNTLRIAPSRGSHLVFNINLSPTGHALMIPRTTDGRVLFAIPWKGKMLAGTTDVAQQNIESKPMPSEEEEVFILQNMQHYMSEPLTRMDISASFAGLRPLAAPKEGSNKTKEISRTHKVIISSNRLCSLIGGKWTTFRKMGQDTLDKARNRGLISCIDSTSEQMQIVSAITFTKDNYVHPDLPYSLEDFESMIKNEYVEKMEDLIERRSRCRFIDEAATNAVLPEINALLQRLK